MRKSQKITLKSLNLMEKVVFKRYFRKKINVTIYIAFILGYYA